MLAMQYSIPLPVNLDADYVRERVSARRALFDGHKGLAHKSFVYCPKEHLYAPFYVWKDVSEARNFLLDDLYQGVIESFGRHRVRSWIVIGMEYGNMDIAPTHAIREIDSIAPEARLKRFAIAEREAQKHLIDYQPELYMHVTALDADRWQVMRFSLWKDAASIPDTNSDCTQSYEVLHVSETR